MRFGLLGTGHWAAETQGAALATHPEAELVGVWGRDGAKAAALAGRYGATPYTDLGALLSEVDAVAIALPPDVQSELALRAARAGKHLLVDKPLATETAAADRIVEAVRERGLSSVVFFTNLFRDNIVRFLDETAATGGWIGARVTQFASIYQPGNPYANSPWRRERGALWDIGPHMLSMVLPVLGPVAEVSAIAGPRATTHLMLRHAGGAVTTASLTLDAPAGAMLRDNDFYGEHGVATVPAPEGSSVAAFGVAIDQLVAGGAERCDVRFGRDVVAVLEAGDIALREMRPVAVA